MSAAQERYIPASTLAARLDKIRSKMTNLAEQIEDLRREEKLLAAILDEAVDGATGKTPTLSISLSTEPKQRAKGVVDAIMEVIQSRPGLSRDELVEGLKYLNLNPFDQNAARRTILNNLGNQIRSAKVRETPEGALYLTESAQASAK